MTSILPLAVKNKDLIEKINSDITTVILKQDMHIYECGMLSGLSGYLLYLYKINEYDSLLGKESIVSEELFNERLEFLQDNLPFLSERIDFGSGLSGQSWLLEFLNQENSDNYDDELCKEIDSFLLECLSVDEWKGEIEMVLGLAGISIYAARRLKKSKKYELFSKIINHFENASKSIDNNQLTWVQPTNSIFRYEKENLAKEEINMGLAHGVPGIIASILPALKIPHLESRVENLLVKSCSWLINQESFKLDRVSCFSTLYEDLEGTRLGWCYGDLTIALTIARVGKALNNNFFIEKAREFSLHATGRTSVNGLIKDAGICHGSAGLSLIFQLLYNELGDIELRNAANYWLDYTLNLYKKDGLKGLYKFAGESQTYEEDSSLLMGYCGIGLSLLSALSGDSSWVDSLLLA